MEFDHLFLCVPPKAQDADLLISAGFTEGTANRHPGQGTANRRFFFDNAFIELLYVEEIDELQSPLTKPLRLDERLHRTEAGISPFGLCFRPTDEADVANGIAPFAGWRYKPGYLPAHLHIDVADAPLEEPMWFYLSFGERPDTAERARQENRVHKNGVSEITSVNVSGYPLTELSDAAKAIVQCSRDPAVMIGNDLDGSAGKNRDHLVELVFDHHKQKQIRDFRPQLPLVCHW